MVILDTSIVIDHLRSKTTKSALSHIVAQAGQASLAISTITIQELYTGKSTQNPQATQALQALLSPFTILSYTYDIAQLAGAIERDSPHLIGFADAAIAATAIHHHIPLVTLNSKDFTQIQNPKLFHINTNSASNP